MPERSCGSHVVLLFLCDHVSRRTMGNTHKPFTTPPPVFLHAYRQSQTYMHALGGGVPRLVVPLLQWLVIIPKWLSLSGPTKVWWNPPRPRCLLYSDVSADVRQLDTEKQWPALKDQSESDSSSLSSETLSVYGHKERKTQRERQREREKLIVHEVQ